jgi:CHAT domain-containing protein
VVEEHAIAYAPSASTLAALESRQRPRSKAPRVIAFGDPLLASGAAPALPNAAREARDVAAVYGANALVATNAEATESRFRELAPQADILHIATHGVLDNASPLSSYVMLAGNGRNRLTDGRVEGRELINLKLGAELVVLSACETALGRITSGEGVVGLSWALFAAGASTTTVSLWPVDSQSTTDLMAAFHRDRQQLSARGAPAPTARALQSAQLGLLGRAESRHPFYWAGFVVIGVP